MSSFPETYNHPKCVTQFFNTDSRTIYSSVPGPSPGSVKIHRKPLFFLNAQKRVVKHTLKLKKVSVYYCLQRKPSSSIKMSEEGQYTAVSVKCVCTKVLKTPNSSSILLKKYCCTHLKCSLQILSLDKKVQASSSVSTVKLLLKTIF